MDLYFGAPLITNETAVYQNPDHQYGLPSHYALNPGELGVTMLGNAVAVATHHDHHSYVMPPQSTNPVYANNLTAVQSGVQGTQLVQSTDIHHQGWSTMKIKKNPQHQLPVNTVISNKGSNPTFKMNNQGKPVKANVHFNKVQNNSTKCQPLEAHAKSLNKIPDPTQVKKNTDSRVKQGIITIQLSDKFLPMSVTGHKMCDIVFMRQFFDISKVSISLSKDFMYTDEIVEAVKKLISNNLLVDWFILKCEEKQLGLFQVAKDLIVYSVNNFSTLVNLIAQESCLPLPFITRDGSDSQKMVYFFVTIAPIMKDKIKKLNLAVFYDADNGRKKFPCRYAGIRLDCTFQKTIEQFVIHVQESALLQYEANAPRIRQLLIYNHLVWGYLQTWTRKVWEHYNRCFKLEDVAKNLSLCQADSSATVIELLKNGAMIYPIDFVNLYVKFDPVVLKDSKTSFSIDNFETNYVCDVTIVQYYRQFFLINDVHFSDALNNIFLFSSWEKVADVCDSQNGEESSSVDHPVRNHEPETSGHIFQEASDTSGKLPDKVSPSKSTDISTLAPQIEKKDCKKDSSKNPSSKPLIKTRTVEEINSCLDIDKLLEPTRTQVDSEKVGERIEEEKPKIPVVVRRILDQCYAKRSVEISSTDESNDPHIVQKCFDEAVRRSAGIETLESFINALYIRLQLHFTTSTCKILMNKMICQALASVPHLKHVLEESQRSSPEEDNEIIIIFEKKRLKVEADFVPQKEDRPSDVASPSGNVVGTEDVMFPCNESESDIGKTVSPLEVKCEFISDIEYGSGRDEVETRTEENPLEETRSSPPPLTPVAATETDQSAGFDLKPCYVHLERLHPDEIRRHTKRSKKNELDGDLAPKRAKVLGTLYESKKINENKSKIGELEHLKARSMVSKHLRKRTNTVESEGLEPEANASDLLTERVKDSKHEKTHDTGRRRKLIGLSEEIKKCRHEEKACGNKEDKNRLQMECLKREVRVNLVRLEETPLFRIYMKASQSDDYDDDDGVANGVHKDKDCNIYEDSDFNNATDTDANPCVGDFNLKQRGVVPKSIPRHKRRFFEIRDGVLYLKDEFAVLNGRIVPVDGEMRDNRDHVKREQLDMKGENSSSSL